MAIDSKDTREVILPVTGMTCASCVRRIEKALSKVEGVSLASVNLATEKAKVVYDPTTTTLETMKKAVERAGYGVRELPPGMPGRPSSRPSRWQQQSDMTLPRGHDLRIVRASDRKGAQ